MDTQIDIRPRHSILESFDGGSIHEDINGSLVSVPCGDVVVEVTRETVRIIGCPVGGEAREDKVEGEGAEISGLVDEGTARDAPSSCSVRESCSPSDNVRALTRVVHAVARKRRAATVEERTCCKVIAP